MAEFSSKPWGQCSESDYETAEPFCAACLIDLNHAGKEKSKTLCKLPVREPGGAVNRNAGHAAAAALAGARGGVDAPPDAKRKVARALIRLYRPMDEEPPESVRKYAIRTVPSAKARRPRRSLWGAPHGRSDQAEGV